MSQGEAFSLTPMQTIFVADAYCGDGKRFVVRADEKLTAFRELEGGDSRSRGSRNSRRRSDEIDSRRFRRSWLLSVVKRTVDRASCLQ